ncbi:MAG: dTDP-4-dehydrorhamnose reductase [Chloroflexi bacterium]|nr:dTDP-4-dehydrorhamnose reductase [Chloroflexota bacterium]
MRVAITGAGGQLGRSLLAIFGDEETLALTKADLDIRSDQAAERLAALRPDLVIHTAAMTDVDECELHPDEAFEINSQGTQRVAQACQKIRAPLVYISTDYVFDGQRAEPYPEDYPPRPINVYGRSKLEGEKQIQDLLTQFYIVRSAWLYGPGNKNFVEKTLRRAEGQPEMHMVTTQVGSPTYTWDLAAGIRRLLAHNDYGIFHLTNSGYCSRYQWARKILELAGKSDYPLHPSTEYQRPAQPPLHAILANIKAAALGITLRPWEEALAAYFRERT